MEPALTYTPAAPADLRPYAGWTLAAAAELDRAAPGFLVSTFGWGSAKRHAVWAVLAEWRLGAKLSNLAYDLHAGAPALSELEPDLLAQIGPALILSRARCILRSLYGHVPDGLLGTMSRLGRDPLSSPAHYRALHRLFASSDPADRTRVRALRQVPGLLLPGQIEAAEALPPVLVHARLLAKLKTAKEASDLSRAFSYVRAHCTGATDAAVRQSIEALPQAMSRGAWLKRWAERFDRLPDAPTLADPTLIILHSGAALTDAGRRYANCLKTKIAEVLLGRAAFVECRLARAKSSGALVELVRTSTGWCLVGLHAHNNRRVPRLVAAEVRTRLAACGIAIRRHASGDPAEMSAAAELLGLWDWAEPDVEGWGVFDPEVEQEEALDALAA